MSEKVKLPKDVCDALDEAKKKFLGYSFHQIVNRLIDEESAYKSIKFFNYYNADTIYRALVLGYEPELSAEEQIKDFYKKHQKVGEYFDGVQKGIEETIRIHGIRYDWME